MVHLLTVWWYTVTHVCSWTSPVFHLYWLWVALPGLPWPKACSKRAPAAKCYNWNHANIDDHVKMCKPILRPCLADNLGQNFKVGIPICYPKPWAPSWLSSALNANSNTNLQRVEKKCDGYSISGDLGDLLLGPFQSILQEFTRLWIRLWGCYPSLFFIFSLIVRTVIIDFFLFLINSGNTCDFELERQNGSLFTLCWNRLLWDLQRRVSLLMVYWPPWHSEWETDL